MYKQVIIVRKDLQMSHGKMAAQVAHASMAFLTNAVRKGSKKLLYGCQKLDTHIDYKNEQLQKIAEAARGRGDDVTFYRPTEETKGEKFPEFVECDPSYIYGSFITMDVPLYEEWIKGAFTKVILQAKSKDAIMKAVELAKEMNLKNGEDYFLIRDNCRTEIKPEDDDKRTLTCIGFKPMDAEYIDQIGKKFHLYTG